MILKRQEFKYYTSNNEIYVLRNSLQKLMKIDQNANLNRLYTVTSLYFDTPYESNFSEKVDGIISREKFRIRKYSTSKIFKFESKKKIENVIEKQSQIINNYQVNDLLNANYKLINNNKSKFLNNSFIKLKAEGYKVKNIVEYDREAYYLPYGNIRITFDLNLRTYNTDTNFNKISNSSIKILPNNTNILEVKFSLPLPDYLKNLLSKTIATRCSISKFVMGQKFMNFSPWNDNITEPF